MFRSLDRHQLSSIEIRQPHLAAFYSKISPNSISVSVPARNPQHAKSLERHSSNSCRAFSRRESSKESAGIARLVGRSSIADLCYIPPRNPFAVTSTFEKFPWCTCATVSIHFLAARLAAPSILRPLLRGPVYHRWSRDYMRWSSLEGSQHSAGTYDRCESGSYRKEDSERSRTSCRGWSCWLCSSWDPWRLCLVDSTVCDTSEDEFRNPLIVDRGLKDRDLCAFGSDLWISVHSVCERFAIGACRKSRRPLWYIFVLTEGDSEKK